MVARAERVRVAVALAVRSGVIYVLALGAASGGPKALAVPTTRGYQPSNTVFDHISTTTYPYCMM